MIEVRTDEFANPITPDGPHTPQGTRAIAAAVNEAFRLLNYATSPEKRGLRYPSDVYSILGTLSAAVAKLPQALHQMSEWTASEVHAGHARENPDYGPHGGNANAAQSALQAATRRAITHATGLAQALDDGQAAMRGMESGRPDDNAEPTA